MMFLGIERDRFFRAVTASLVGRPRPAFAQGKDLCQRSGACCHQSPPQLTPDDVRRLSTHFGMDPPSFVASYCVLAEPGYVPENDGAMLARHTQTTGVILADEESWIPEPCILFDRDAWGCLVHEVKPMGCAQWGCWMDRRAIKIAKWTEEERRELLGRMAW